MSEGIPRPSPTDTPEATTSPQRPRPKSTLAADAVAGLSTSLVLVPQAMGYALLAGLPPLSGLHAATLALFVYAALGTSAALAVGPVAMDSLLTATALGSAGLTDASATLAAAGLLAAMTGLAQILMGLLRLGHLGNFLSTPVVVGFTSAAALLILLTQVPSLLGVPSLNASDVVPLLDHLARQLPRTNLAAAAVGAVSVVGLLALEKLRPTWPRAPIVLALVTAGVELLRGLLEVPRVGTIPFALPHPHLTRALDASLVATLAPHALTLALVAFAEGFSVAKNYSARYGEPDASRELVALGGANVASALSGGYPVTGGLSRSAVLVRAGARTKRAGAFTAVGVLVASVVLAPVLGLIPRAALAAVVAVSVVSLVDVAGAKRLVKVKPVDGAFIAISFVATLALGFQWGIGLGILASVAMFLLESTRPHVAVLGRIPGTTTYRNVARYPEAETVPGFLIVRIDAQLYFGNATFLRNHMAELVAQAGPGLHTIILDASGVNQLDSSAERALAALVDEYDARGLSLVCASVKGPVRDVMKRSGLWKRLGRERLYLDVHAAVQTLRPSEPEEGEARAFSPAI